MDIKTHIMEDERSLSLAKETGNSGMVRHFEEELAALRIYDKSHPGEKHDPTSLELYCELYPDADECRIYEA